MARPFTGGQLSRRPPPPPLSTASGKRSENDGSDHESRPTENGLRDPSLFLDPKIGKHRRIANGSGPQKTPPTHHVAERAVMSRERPPRKRRGQERLLRTSNLPLNHSHRSRRDRGVLVRSIRATRHTTTPFAGQKSSRRRGRPSGSNTRASQHPPPSSRPSEGREGDEGEASGCVTSEERRS